jgi:hypothetical protein
MLHVAWTPAPRQNHLIDLKDSEHHWINVLRDTRDDFTMAVVIETCLDFDYNVGKSCGRPNGISILGTALIVNETIKPCKLKLRLRHNEKEYHWESSSLNNGDEFFLGHQKGAWTVIEPLRKGRVLLKWTPMVSHQLSYAFNKVIGKTHNERHIGYLMNDNEIDAQHWEDVELETDETDGEPMNASRIVGIRPLQVYIVAN